MTIYDRKAFFDAVRQPLFQGSMSQQQVDGMSFKLDVWESHHDSEDRRWLAYALATSKHETASKMWPVEENGKGAGYAYGKPVAETGFAYYGRGDVQLTWADNYKSATARLGLTGDNDLYWNPQQALDPRISADVLFTGMIEGWFRKPHSLPKYFGAVDDPYNARDIINGDKKTVPKWSNGVSIGNLIKGYHLDFLEALDAAARFEPEPEPMPAPELLQLVTVDLTAPDGVAFNIRINGVSVVSWEAPSS